MSRTGWAELALCVFERLTWVQAWYWTLAAIYKALTATWVTFAGSGDFYQEGSLEEIEVAFAKYLFSAVFLHTVAFYLRGRSSLLVDFSDAPARNDVDSDSNFDDNLPQVHTGDETLPVEASKAMYPGAELITVALIVFGVSQVLPGVRSLVDNLLWWSLLSQLYFDDALLSERHSHMIARVTPAAVEVTVGLALLLFAKPLARRLTRRTTRSDDAPPTGQSPSTPAP